MNIIDLARTSSGRLFEIRQRRALCLRLRAHSQIACITGQARVTQEALSADIILAGGDSTVLAPNEHVVISGLAQGTLVYVIPTRSATAGSVIFTGDFIEAAEARARKLRRAELARLASAMGALLLHLPERFAALANRLATQCHGRPKKPVRCAA